jgi:hypothetical protein
MESFCHSLQMEPVCDGFILELEWEVRLPEQIRDLIWTVSPRPTCGLERYSCWAL